MFNSCAKYTGGTACHSDFIMLQAAKGRTLTLPSLWDSVPLILFLIWSPRVSNEGFCVLMNAQCEMKVKWNPISSSDQVYFAQGLTGSVPENLCLISRGELTSVCVREAVLVHLSGQVIVSVAFVNEVLLTRVLRNTYCQLQPTLSSWSFHPQQT